MRRPYVLGAMTNDVQHDTSQNYPPWGTAMKHIVKVAVASAALILGTATTAGAAVTFDESTGTGFVGKGDVQLAFGWNNAALNANANGVDFEATTVTEQKTTWTCDRDAGPQTQERRNTTETTTQGVVTKIHRDNKRQITGFILDGYQGTPVVSEEHEGPAVGSCPTGWTAIDFVEGPETVVESGLFVTYSTQRVQLL